MTWQPSQVLLGDTLRVSFGVTSSTGAATNADSLPTVVVLRQGAPMAYSPAVANVATGMYEAAVVCSAVNGFSEQAEYSAYMTVVQAGITGRDGLASFRVGTEPRIGIDDTIRVCFGTAISSGEATNADALPTCTVLKQGVALAYSPTVTNVTTGLYEIAIACSAANGFERTKEYGAYVSATVTAVTGRDSVASFIITGPTYPTASSATTPQAIRDRALTVIEALIPSHDSGVKFKRYRNEGDAYFQSWSDTNPASCRRRFQVRVTGNTETPPVSNTNIEQHQCTLHVTVAYPQSGRDGRSQAMDRDDTMDADAFQIDKAIGMLGRGNFSAPYADACWIEGSPEVRTTTGAVDFVELTFTYLYYRTR